jgi:hypothetical protein
LTQTNQPRGQATATVVNADVENLLLVIFAPVPLSGRLTIDGQSIATLTSLDRLRVQLAPSIDTTTFIGPVAQSQSQSPSADGTFRIENLLPADYRVSVAGMPPGYYLKSVRLEQTEAIDQPLHVTSSSVGPLEVVISPNGGQIEGTLVDDKQQPVGDTLAVLIPEQQRNRSDLYSTARSDQYGRFTMRGISPGDYRVFAWEAIEQFAYYDPDFMRLFEARGKGVHISEGSKQSVEVRIIPATEP